MDSILILKLQQNKYFICNYIFPIKEHITNSNFCMSYLPVVEKYIHKKYTKEEENDYLIQLVIEYGIENVEGDFFSVKYFKSEKIPILMQYMNKIRSRCYKCEKYGHFGGDCVPHTLGNFCCQIQYPKLDFCCKNITIDEIKQCKVEDFLIDDLLLCENNIQDDSKSPFDTLKSSSALCLLFRIRLINIFYINKNFLHYVINIS